MPGDDIRHIDWNITAKLKKPYIKIFREERELNVVIASMLNGSVYFGSKRFKQDVIAEVNALLSFSTIKNGDMLSSYIFAEKMFSHLKPSKKLFQVHRSVQEIVEFEPLNHKADYKAMADTLFKRLRRKCDFFEVPDLKLLAKKHEVIAIIVRDRLEEHPPEMGFRSLVDPESGSVLEGDFNAQTVKDYAKKVLLHDRELYATLRKHQIRFGKIYTDENVSVGLRRLFEGR